MDYVDRFLLDESLKLAMQKRADAHAKHRYHQKEMEKYQNYINSLDIRITELEDQLLSDGKR